MNTVIALCGDESTKTVAGTKRLVTPFVGTDFSGPRAQMGVGYLSKDGQAGSFWGLLLPHALIRSWQAMKLLEKASQIDDGTLCACYYLASEKERNDSHRHYTILTPAFGSLAALERARVAVISSYPTADELESMLTTLHKNNVEVSTLELNHLLRHGHIKTSPMVEKVLKEEADKEKVRERNEALKSIGVHTSSVHKVAPPKVSPRSGSGLNAKGAAAPAATEAKPTRPKSIWRKLFPKLACS